MADSTHAKLSGKKIIVVEDEAFLGNIIASQLGNAGATVTLINEGTKAFESIREIKPHVVILDIQLPGESGLEILKKVRAESSIKETPIIIFSNFGDEKNLKSAQDSHAEAYLIKATVSVDEIVDEINKVLVKK